MDDGVNFCTGVLVNESYALTERHCVNNANFPSWKTWKVVGAGGVTVVAERAARQPSSTAAILKLRQPLRAAAYARLQVAAVRTPLAAFAVGRRDSSRDAPLVASKTLTSTRPTESSPIQARCYSSGGDSGGGLYLQRRDGEQRDVVIGFEHDPEGWCGDPDSAKVVSLHDLFTPVTQDLVTLIATLSHPGGAH